MICAKIFLCVAGALMLAACNSGATTASNNTAVTGVATAAQISVVTAK